MPRTSDKAEKIVDYVNQFILEHGYSPSVREIGAAVGLRSTASVSYHLQALQEKGLLQSPGAKGRKRAIVTNALPENYTYFYTCGPEPMLKAVYKATSTSGQMSFEERMGYWLTASLT